MTGAALPILYTFRRCPYAMRARLAIHQAGNPVEAREVVLRDKPAHLLAISAKATTPTMQLPDGSVLDESLDIMHWALLQRDPAAWLAAVDDPDNHALITANDGPFKRALDRYKYPNRYPVEDCTGAQDDCALFLAQLDARLATAGHLAGAAEGLADMAIFPFVRQCANVDRVWFDALPLPTLHRWLTRHLDGTAFAAIMVKWPPWQPESLPLVWP